MARIWARQACASVVEPAGFAKIAAPVMVRAMRRANRKDLRRLKEILERKAVRSNG